MAETKAKDAVALLKEDHRAVEVELTRRGRALWREMNVSYRRSVQARFAVILDDGDVEAIASTLRILSTHSTPENGEE